MYDDCECPDQSARIADLERQLKETKAALVHNYYFVSMELDKFSTNHCFGSGVVLEIAMLGGKRVIEPILIRDGLSPETIEALQADLRRSYLRTTELHPKGMDSVDLQ